VERPDEEIYRMYFRTEDIDFSEVEDEEVTLGLGYFPKCTMLIEYFDSTGSGPFKTARFRPGGSSVSTPNRGCPLYEYAPSRPRGKR